MSAEGVKGSQYWMRKIANTPELSLKIEEELESGSLKWKSPLSRSFHEYRLNEQLIREKILGLDDVNFKRQFDFWPSQQPVWDGIAISEAHKELFLFEAKAHIGEMKSKCRANPESKQKIEKSMKVVYESLALRHESGIFNNWMNKYYQLGNRLTFLYYMNKMNLPNIKHTTLVLLNIVDDIYVKTNQETWAIHYKSVFNDMMGRSLDNDDVKDVKIVFFNAIEAEGSGVEIQR